MDTKFRFLCSTNKQLRADIVNYTDPYVLLSYAVADPGKIWGGGGLKYKSKFMFMIYNYI